MNKYGRLLPAASGIIGFYLFRQVQGLSEILDEDLITPECPDN